MDEPLSDIEHIRKRPSMYIGDTTTRGLHLLPGELVSNVFDEFLKGRASIAKVNIDDGCITVTDDGAGLPFDQPSGLGNESLADDYLVSYHNKPSADDHAPHIHIHSPIGAGLCTVNALSKWLIVESWRDGKLYRRSFERGELKSASVVNPQEAGRLRGVEPMKFALRMRGTNFSCCPDPEIFGDSKLDPKNLRRNLFDAVHLAPGIVVELQGERFYAPGGLVDLAAFQSSGSPHTLFAYDGEVEQIIVRAVASGKLSGKSKDETEWLTWANGIKTWYCKSSGTHQTAFSKALETVGWRPRTALIHVIAKEAKFAGPTKTKLDMPEKEAAMTEALTIALQQFLAD